MIQQEYARREIRKLARQGKLMDTAFKLYQRAVYPGAPPDQIAALRTTFFAGAAEMVALMTAGADDTDPETTSEAEEAMVFAVFDEVTRFHERTIDTIARPKGST